MGPMRRVMVGFEAPTAPVEAAWARLRYPTSTQAKFANGSLEGDGLEGDGRSTRVDLAAALRLLDQNGQSDLAAGFFAARHPHHRDLFYAADHGVFWEEALPSDSVWKSTSVSGAPDNSSLSNFSTMTWPRWLRRAVRNRHRHAIEQASRRWRGGRRGDSDERTVKF